MPNILVVTSSVREGRVADKVLAFAKEQLAKYENFDVSVADLKELQMPFFDNPHTPSDDAFSPTDEVVKQWGSMVSEADAVVILAAEYNHSYTPVLKNAIDWLYKEWLGKPVVFIGYGWVGGARAIKHLRDVFASGVDGKPMETEANLRFMKELDTQGNFLDIPASEAAVKTTLEELQNTLG